MAFRPYELFQPQQRTTSLIFTSPHSGRAYPPGFLKSSILDERTIRTSEDAFVDQLLDCVPGLGAPLLAATAPRAYIDLNRAPDELDPALVEGVKAQAHNPRISSGLGVIPRVVSGGRAIYRGKIPFSDARARIEGCWHPFHAQLQLLLDGALARFGEAILIDVHSMPHEAVDSVPGLAGRKPDIVIGDRFGASAGATVVDRVEAAFRDAGFRVSRNVPFAGAYITQAYGRPSRGQHAVQVELDRSLYMNEAEIRPNGNFAAFRRTLAAILQDIVAIGRGAGRLAAE
ncbi:MAG: N-formylglutamate amidohydrolase [Rhodobacteraceae bacterium]|nr:N-formylglutamate amidohydrolase [Paracoccaceae bacterium]